MPQRALHDVRAVIAPLAVARSCVDARRPFGVLDGPARGLAVFVLASLGGACTSQARGLAERSPIVAPAAGEDAGAGAHGSPPALADARWVTITVARMADVEVERALYEKAGARHFFVHMRVQNRRATPIAVDLRPYFGVFYPNQWGASDSPQRGAVDERRAVPPPLDPTARTKLLADLHAGLLTGIPAHATVDYYRDFNASTRADVDAQSRSSPYVIVAMGGWLDVTDGADVERVLPAADPAREVALEVPVRWGQIPGAARVLADR
jgi:hypothetical protein